MSEGDPFRQDWAAGRVVPVADGRRCVWCQTRLGHAEGGLDAAAPAVCDACAAVLATDNREPLASFIERVDAPLLVVSASGVIELANARARVFLGKAADGLVGRLHGDVIECLRAAEPGGCGGTVHCSGCALRRAVLHTHETGEAVHAHSYHDVRSSTGIRTVWLDVATERAGDLVLLRLSRIGIERRA